jgi:hypothetical protein
MNHRRDSSLVDRVNVHRHNFKLSVFIYVSGRWRPRVVSPKDQALPQRFPFPRQMQANNQQRPLLLALGEDRDSELIPNL